MNKKNPRLLPARWERLTETRDRVMATTPRVEGPEGTKWP